VPELPAADVPEPARIARAGNYYSILSPGIGGTGVVTAGALLATAAWIDGLAVITLDQTGLAQKGGAVLSSIILSEQPIEASARIGAANADLLLGFDLLGAAAAENLKRAHPGRTVAVVNTAEIPTAESIRGTNRLAGPGAAIDLINRYTRPGHNVFIDASRVAEGLFSSHLAANIFLLGAAWQAGLIPISRAALEEAIQLNGVEAARNLQAFLWGRRYYHDAAAVEALLAPPTAAPASEGSLVDRRASDLERYQNRAYAGEYRRFVESVAARQPALTDTVARYLYKLMAYKDEYEVARLLTQPAFERQTREMWQQPEAIEYNLHPPLLRAFGWKKKVRFGAWFHTPLRLLASMKSLRGTPLDPFGYLAARREERELIAWYRDLVTRTLDVVTPDTLPAARELLSLPEGIRGYEEVKRESIRAARAAAEEKWRQWRQVSAAPIDASSSL
jgi:indolepyruvate ferredoxin oxidoreductase